MTALPPTWNGRTKILNTPSLFSPVKACPCPLASEKSPFPPGLWILQDPKNRKTWKIVPYDADYEVPEVAAHANGSNWTSSPVAWAWLSFLVSESPLVPIICFLSPILHHSHCFQRLPCILPINSFLLNLVRVCFCCLQPWTLAHTALMGNIHNTNKDILNFIVNLRKKKICLTTYTKWKTKNTQFYLVNILVFQCVMNSKYWEEK